MKFHLTLLAAAVMAVAVPVTAAANTQVTLDFEGAPSFASIAERYAAQGISFGNAALALANDGSGSGVDGAFFTNAPKPGDSNPLAGTVMFVDAVSGSAVMNLSASATQSLSGFVDRVSFDYASTADAFNLVQVFTGLNGTGQRLAKISLSENQIDSGCNSSSFCHWQNVSMSFSGTAQSLVFASNGGNIAYDNISISAVPEPETYMLLVAGLLTVGFVVRRRQV